MTDEKRKVHVKLGIFHCVAQTSWSSAALIFEDRTGDVAPRKVTLQIERPSDIAYIRERLDNIEDAWRKELDCIKVNP